MNDTNSNNGDDGNYFKPTTAIAVPAQFQAIGIESVVVGDGDGEFLPGVVMRMQTVDGAGLVGLFIVDENLDQFMKNLHVAVEAAIDVAAAQNAGEGPELEVPADDE